MISAAKIRTSLFMTALALLLAGCMVQLAPRYDASLYNGITRVNPRIMELFATVAAGSEASSFAEREPAYNSIIGTVDALALQFGDETQAVERQFAIVEAQQHLAFRYGVAGTHEGFGNEPLERSRDGPLDPALDGDRSGNPWRHGPGLGQQDWRSVGGQSNRRWRAR